MSLPFWKRIRKSIWATGIVLALGTPQAQGQIFHRKPYCPPQPNCPPIQIVPPSTTEPTKPGEPKVTPEPVTPPPVEAPSLGSESFAALGGSSFSAPANSPNMFGAYFGASPVFASIPVPPVIVNGTQQVFIVDGNGNPQSLFPKSNSTGNAVFTTTVNSPLGTVNIPAGTQFISVDPVKMYSTPGIIPLSENQMVTSLVNQNFQNTTGSTGQTVYNGGVAQLVQRQSGGGFGGVGDVGAFFFPFDPYNIGPLNYSYQGVIPQPPIIVNMTNPSGGGVVGRLQIAENINPLPRDRIIFDYDYFNNVPLTAGGWDVHRFVMGFEKTFFNQRTSIEIRVPFASTLNSQMVQGFQNTNTEFGNIRLMLKALLWRGDVLNVASGIAFHLPTANDTRVSLPNGTDLIRINNNSTILTPYVGALFTPNDRLFAQSWIAFDVDPSGNPVYANPNLGGLQRVGQLTSQTLMQLDGQMGYWIIRNDNPSATLRGLAPFVELHYFTTLGNPDAVQSGNLLITDLGGNRDELDLTAGITTQLGNRTNLSMGAVVPLRNQFDRSFDFQFGVRLNIFFGPSARTPGPGTYAPSF